MGPVWTLFSRRTLSRLAYWLSALGYDLRDRSVVNRVYLVYFCAFWLAWGMAMLALAGGGLARAFIGMQSTFSPPELVLTLGTYLLAAWMGITAWQVSRRSPFVFSEDDAYLVCQTPVSRSRVGLAWFFQGVMGMLLVVAALLVVLAFALVAWRFPDEPGLSLVFVSIRVSLLALVLVLPMVVGLQAAIWSLGAYRLHRSSEPAWLRWVVLGLAALYVVGLWVPPANPTLVAPFRLPLAASLSTGIHAVAAGPVGVFVLAVLAGGLVLLWSTARDMNLSRSAQETTHVAALAQARSYAQFDLVDSILVRRRLGTARRPSRLWAGASKHVLIRKDLVQVWRSFRLRDLVSLVWLFGVSAVMVRPSSWALQMLAAGAWTISLGGLLNRRLRNDLAHWWLWRSLPVQPGALLVDEAALAWCVVTLLGWLALPLSNLPPLSVAAAAWIMPVSSASVAMAGARDILRQAKARTLMSPSLAEENVPRQGVGGAIQGLASVLVPFGLFGWLAATPMGAVGGVAALAAAVGIAQLNRRAALISLREVE